MKLPFKKRNVWRISPMFSDPKTFLFKNICNEKLYWDDTIPEEFTKEWRSLLNSLGDIKHISIDRYVSTTSNPDDFLELHGFCNASNAAYCAAIYTRVISNSSVLTSLLAAKCQQFLKKRVIDLRKSVLVSKQNNLIN